MLDLPISVAPDLATLEDMLASVEDRQRYDQIVAEGGVLLVPGGAPVSVLTTQGDYVQVRLQLCDIQGNDITGRTRWTHQLFLQTTQAATL